MSDEKWTDPPRLLDAPSGGEGDDTLRALLGAGRSDLPDEARMSALAAKLGPLVGAAGGGAGAASLGGGKIAASAGGAAKATGLLATLKVVVATVVGAVALGAVVGVSRSLSSRSPASSASVIPSSGTALTEPAPPMPEVPASIAQITDVPPSATAPVARAQAATADDDPAEEVKLLERAQDALRTDPSRALALTAEHQRRYAHPALAQEREVIAIEALARAGRTDEARARAARFAASYPASPHLRRVRQLVEAP